MKEHRGSALGWRVSGLIAAVIWFAFGVFLIPELQTRYGTARTSQTADVAQITGWIPVAVVAIALAVWLLKRRAGRPKAAATIGTPPVGGDWSIRLGRNHDGEQIWTPPLTSTILVGVPESGKTKSVLLPAIASWNGPVVATSTKRDIFAAVRFRAARGPVMVFDPANFFEFPAEARVGWSPLQRCKTYDGAIGAGEAMLSIKDPNAGGADQTHKHFTLAARSLLAPLLYAAAEADYGMDAVRKWVLGKDAHEPASILQESRKEDAEDALADLYSITDRSSKAGGDYLESLRGTAQVALAWAQRSVVRKSTDPRILRQFDPQEWLKQSGTLFIVSPSQLQSELAPLVVALLDSIHAEAIKCAQQNPSGRVPTPVLYGLDEAANIAPWNQLPAVISEAVQQGIYVIAGCQGISQVEAKWGREDARTIWSGVRTRVVLANNDPATVELTRDAAGKHLVKREQRTESTSRQWHWLKTKGHTGGKSSTIREEHEDVVKIGDLGQMRPYTAWVLQHNRSPQHVELERPRAALEKEAATDPVPYLIQGAQRGSVRQTNPGLPLRVGAAQR